MKNIAVFFVVLVSLSGYLFAQEGLYLSPSPELTAMGGTGTAVLTNDAFAFYYNPAQLGQWSKENNFATHFYANKTDIYPGMDYNENLLNTSVAAGYNFKNVLPNVDLSIGLGYLYNRLGYENRLFYYNSTIISGFYDYYKSYSLGVGLHSLIDFSLGISYKNLYSVHKDDPDITFNKSTGLIDYGAFLNIPVHKLLYPENKFPLAPEFNPFLNVSIGCSFTNVKKISAGDAPLSLLAQRYARLGYSFDFGTDYSFHKQNIRLFEIKWITEAESYLNWSRTPSGDIHFQGGFGELDLSTNLIQRKSSEFVVLLSGFSLSFLNIITINSGSGSSYPFTNVTGGTSVHLQGILELANALFPSPAIAMLVKHVDVQYDHGVFFKGFDGYETKMDGIQVLLKNFTF